MILPTKHVPFDSALIRVGGDLLAQLEEPTTVTTLWTWAREGAGIRSFDQFSLALSFLFAINAVDARDGLIVSVQ